MHIVNVKESAIASQKIKFDIVFQKKLLICHR